MIDEPTLYQMLEQARGYVEERKLLHASQVYRRITDIAPDVEAAWVELAHVYSELRQYEAAEQVLQRAMARSSDPHKITFLLGNLYFNEGDYHRALSYYKQLLVHERKLSLTLRSHLQFNIALSYLSKGNYKLAESHFRKTKRIDPQFPKINESLGEVLVRRNLLSEAVTVLRQATTTDPFSWIGHYLLGLALARQQEWLEAYDEFTSAIEMDPNEPNAWQMCGEVLLALGRDDEAEQYLRRSLELNPEMTDAIANVGTLYMRRGDSETALECFERALALEPHNSKALRGKQELQHAGKTRS